MEESVKLTAKQEKVLDCIKKYQAEHGFPPAVREICEILGLSSPATVQSHINNLKKAGVIRNSSNKFRTIELLVENEYLNEQEGIIKVPLLGKVTAGNPIEAIEKPNEFFELPACLVPLNKTVFTLKVSGESMINKGIHDGDIVVAMTDENEVTLKTFYKEDGHIRLQPENDTMSPFIFNNVTILGKAIGLFHQF